MTPQAIVDHVVALVIASRDEEALAFWSRVDLSVIEQMTAKQLDTALDFLSSATRYADVRREAAAATHAAD